MSAMPPEALAAAARVWERTLQRLHPEWRDVSVSFVGAEAAAPTVVEPSKRRRAGRRRRRLSHQERAAIYVAHGGRCGICGLAVALDEMHLDHVVPLARGGIDEPSNLQPAHRGCNVSKGAS